MKVVCFTGHRPKELFGSYDANHPKANVLAEKLMKQIETLIVEKQASTFLTAGAQGVDQIAFMCVNWLKKKYPHIQNVLAIPYKDQPKAWENTLQEAKEKGWKKAIIDLETTLRRYQAMIQAADQVIYVDTIDAYKPKNMKEEDIGRHDNAKLHLASLYMLDQADFVVAVYNGSKKGGTYRCVEEAKKRNMDIMYLNPHQNFDVTPPDTL